MKTPASFLLSQRAVERSTRNGLQEARLGLLGLAAVTILGCADAGARLVGRLLDPGPEPARARPEKARESWGMYVVQPGDTLGEIATCRGVSINTLAQANQIRAPNHLIAGAHLRVPAQDRCATAHLVRKPAQPEKAPTASDRHFEARRLLADATARYDGADFEEALAVAELCIEQLVPEPEAGGEGNALRARCHVVAGMAAAGLEHRELAIDEFRRAIHLDPEVAFDPEKTSPRVLELVTAARENR
jgi:LysM repeat protein